MRVCVFVWGCVRLSFYHILVCQGLCLFHANNIWGHLLWVFSAWGGGISISKCNVRRLGHQSGRGVTVTGLTVTGLSLILYKGGVVTTAPQITFPFCPVSCCLFSGLRGRGARRMSSSCAVSRSFVTPM
jgi:hypothetical protein